MGLKGMLRMMAHTGNNRGFTLIELAVVMIVTGVLLSAFTYPYAIYQKNKKNADVQ